MESLPPETASITQSQPARASLSKLSSNFEIDGTAPCKRIACALADIRGMSFT